MKKVLSQKKTTVIAFVLGIVLLVTGGVGSTVAKLQYESGIYNSQYGMYDIGVTLNENGNKISWRDYAKEGEWTTNTGALLENMLVDDGSLKIGKAYKEALDVTNTGTIDEYVRVSIYKYWMKDDVKLQNVSPSLIDLHLVNLDKDWILDEDASTSERTVLYYNKLLPVGETTPALSDTLTINDMVATKVTQTTEKRDDGYTYITTAYDYDGLTFYLEATVDAVQDHNAEHAMHSAWGKNITVKDHKVLKVE